MFDPRHSRRLKMEGRVGVSWERRARVVSDRAIGCGWGGISGTTMFTIIALNTVLLTDPWQCSEYTYLIIFKALVKNRFLKGDAGHDDANTLHFYIIIDIYP